MELSTTSQWLILGGVVVVFASLLSISFVLWDNYHNRKRNWLAQLEALNNNSKCNVRWHKKANHIQGR